MRNCLMYFVSLLTFDTYFTRKPKVLINDILLKVSHLNRFTFVAMAPHDFYLSILHFFFVIFIKCIFTFLHKKTLEIMLA